MEVRKANQQIIQTEIPQKSEVSKTKNAVQNLISDSFEKFRKLLRIARRLNVFTGRRYKERAGEWSSDALRLSPTKSIPPCTFIWA